MKVLRRRARYLNLNVICTFQVCVFRLIAQTLLSAGLCIRNYNGRRRERGY